MGEASGGGRRTTVKRATRAAGGGRNGGYKELKRFERKSCHGQGLLAEGEETQDQVKDHFYGL